MDIIYSGAELGHAPLISMRLNALERDMACYRPDQFDFSSACSRCGSGARIIAPMILDPSRLPTNSMICQTAHYEYFVTEPLFQALSNANLSGLRLIQAVDARGDRLPWWHLVPAYELPPMTEETRMSLRGDPSMGCRRCGRDNFFDGQREPVQIVYSRKEIGKGTLPDVATTYECFGISGLSEPFENSHIAHGLVLISPNGYSVFRALKVRGVRFEPIRIDEN
jgi:hypothetical protein